LIWFLILTLLYGEHVHSINFATIESAFAAIEFSFSHKLLT